MHSGEVRSIRLTQEDRERLARARAADDFRLLVRVYCRPEVTPDELAQALESVGWRGPDDTP